ncbi:MAG: DUF4143 domain-containing protein [Actinomycetaceae bacterium]|nr:DUF4143 domain-containing protein [Actinomycetaceae bacterium]
MLQQFGKQSYKQLAYFNLERYPELAAVFRESLAPKKIIQQLMLTRPDLRSGEIDTLYVFDEIQAVPEAIHALKYFAEEAPQLHVIGAGSLLGIVMRKNSSRGWALSGDADLYRGGVADVGSGTVSFPVGKVESHVLHPMSFKEFLLAKGYNDLVVDVSDKFFGQSKTVTATLEKELAEFMLVGGMPEAVKTWLDTYDMTQVERIHQQLLTGYRADFAKYVPSGDVAKINAIWDSIPAQLAEENRKFIFGAAMKGKRAKDLADALQWLVDAGLVIKVPVVKNPKIPLIAVSDPTHFKLYLCDMGLLRSMAGLPAISLNDIVERSTNFVGAIGENYVLAELVKQGLTVYFWRSKATAELDGLVQIGSNVIPVEIKAAHNKKAKSLRTYIDSYHPKLVVRCSLHRCNVTVVGDRLANNSKEPVQLLSLPHYYVWMFHDVATIMTAE